MDHFASQLGYHDFAELRNVVRDGILGNLGYAIVGVVALISRWSTFTVLINAFFSDLRRYKGTYYGYRWGVTALVKPTIVINQNFLGQYRLRWKMPQGANFRDYKIQKKLGREIYAAGFNGDTKSHSLFVIQANDYNPIEVLIGIYCFMNTGGTTVSGNFLLSRSPLSDDAVRRLLPKTVVAMDKKQAAIIYASKARVGKANLATLPSLRSWVEWVLLYKWWLLTSLLALATGTTFALKF